MYWWSNSIFWDGVQSGYQPAANGWACTAPVFSVGIETPSDLGKVWRCVLSSSSGLYALLHLADLGFGLDFGYGVILAQVCGERKVVNIPTSSVWGWIVVSSSGSHGTQTLCSHLEALIQHGRVCDAGSLEHDVTVTAQQKSTSVIPFSMHVLTHHTYVFLTLFCSLPTQTHC